MHDMANMMQCNLTGLSGTDVWWKCKAIDVRYDARCKQMYGWQIIVQWIFLIKIHIKHFLF